MKILIVDDHEENQYLLESLLRGNGHATESAGNGAEALEHLKSGGFDLIVSDILMPVMDGFELCRKIRADPGLCHVPFIVYTSTYTGPQDEIFARRIGADRFLRKPCEPDIFMEAVQDVMASRDSAAPPPMPAPEGDVLKLYNERLVRKLEQKMLQLEGEVQARENAEKTLRRSEERYRSLYNCIRDAILISDTERTIIDCNPAFVDLFGYSLEEIAGEKSLTVYETEAGFWWLGNESEEHINQNGFLHTVNFKKKDGTVFKGEVNVYPLRNDKGALTGFIELIRDITERLHDEEEREKLQVQLGHSQKMESVGRLAGGVAHDFNNMLGVILGHSDMALTLIDQTQPLFTNLQEIRKAAERSANLTRQLLAFARKQTVTPKILDLNETVSGMIKMLQRLIGEDIDLVWHPGNDLWRIKIDPSQIDQILVNVCVNARDAISDVGKITIETKCFIFDEIYYTDFEGVFPGEYVLLAISDNGCGMDKETQNKLFEPFFTTKEMGKGTGLGLATVYGIVKQNNGFINVYSEPGQGTSFKIYLPRFKDLAGSLQQKSLADAAGLGHETVLLVEDEVGMLKIATEMLQSYGYTVLAADTPGKAIELAAQYAGNIDLLLTDVILPEMNGQDLARRILAMHPDMKQLFMSGYTADVIAHCGVLNEGVNFIEKPFSLKDIVAKVVDVLDSK